MTGGGNLRSLKHTLGNGIILGDEILAVAEMGMVKTTGSGRCQEMRGQNVEKTLHMYVEMAKN